MELIHEECSQTDVTVTCSAVFPLLLFLKFMSAFSYQLSILLFGPGDGRKEMIVKDLNIGVFYVMSRMISKAQRAIFDHKHLWSEAIYSKSIEIDCSLMEI